MPGYGRALYSVVPPGFARWHNPDVTKYGVGLSAEERLNQATAILSEVGYTWQDGKLKTPDSKSVEAFDIITPTKDYDPIRAKIGELIATELGKLGVTVNPKEMAIGDINKRTFDHDFDAYILGYHLPPEFYYLYTFFHSSFAPQGGYNTPGYVNSEFDNLIVKIVNENMSADIRKAQLAVAQEIIANDLPIIPLYYTEKTEAYRNDRFEGWVDMVGGIVNIWTFRNLSPAAN
jgi:ABC-type transport system substrate-binding protein